MDELILDNEASAGAALDVMQAHIDALNARDGDALTATLHFPHYRLSGSALRVWESRSSYLDDFYARAGDDWSHSTFPRIEVVDASGDQVHLNVDVARFRADGSVITRFRSLWVITLKQGKWAAQLRSSFAPDRAGVPVS